MLCDISFAIWKELKIILFWEFFDSSDILGDEFLHKD